MGEGVGDAVNIAARLQSLARPGTVCISEGVYQQVRSRFDETFVDLGKQPLKNIAYPVHAYLVVPRERAAAHLHPARRATPRWAVPAVVLLVLGVVGGAVTAVHHRWRTATNGPPTTGAADRRSAVSAEHAESPPALPAVADVPEEHVALGVMLFKSLGRASWDDWRRDALRDGLNTQLSQLSRVKVYSKEFIDFLISRKGLTEIEVATQLGITKMISGSVVVIDGTVRIETHVVDVKTGVLETSYTISGKEADFLKLQDDLVLGVIAQLDLPVTPEEKQLLLTKRSTDADALKMLLEAEGWVAPPPARGPAPGPRSARPQWLALLPRVRPAPARADDAATRTAILGAIERYRRAMEAEDLQALSALYTDFAPEQQAAQQRYFGNVRDLKISIDNPDIAVVGDEAVVSYTRTDNFTDARTGRQMHVAVRLTKILRQQNGEWKMAWK